MERKLTRIRKIVLFSLIAFLLYLSPSVVYAGGGSSQAGFTVDSIPPAAVADLAVVGRAATSVTLRWTAPGDNGASGTATQYDIRYSNSSINTTAEWSVATPLIDEPQPRQAGSTENLTITGLSPFTTYWFALKTADDVPNWSDLSNTVADTTLGKAQNRNSDSYDDGDGDGRGNPEQPSPPLLEIDVAGKGTSGGMVMSEGGALLESVKAVSTDAGLILLLPKGTTVLDYSGNPPESIYLKLTIPPETPPTTHTIGPGYDLQPSCTFDPPIELIIRYDPELISEGANEQDMVIAYFNEDSQQWEAVPSAVDILAQTVTGYLSHSSIYALLEKPPALVEPPAPVEPTVPVEPPVLVEPPALEKPPAPVEPPTLVKLPALVKPHSFSVDIENLNVTSSQVKIWGFLPFAVRTGEEVTITIEAVNSGSKEGTYIIILHVNGEMQETKNILLQPQQRERVVFTMSGNQLGHYVVAVNGLTKEFTSSVRINWWLVGGSIAVLAVIFSFTAWRFRRRQKYLEE